jgi:hypothetical protein
MTHFTEREYDPRFNPQADVLASQALDVDIEWEPTTAEVVAVMQQPDYLIQLAKRMAQEQCEQNDCAWYWYIGWAHRLISIKQAKGMTLDEAIKDAGI